MNLLQERQQSSRKRPMSFQQEEATLKATLDHKQTRSRTIC